MNQPKQIHLRLQYRLQRTQFFNEISVKHYKTKAIYEKLLLIVTASTRDFL